MSSSRRQALFTDLIYNEEGDLVRTADIGGVPHYVVPDGDFLRHVEAEQGQFIICFLIFFPCMKNVTAPVRSRAGR